MNSGSFSLEPISHDGALVTISLVLVAILAVLTIIAMVFGARLKRQRRKAEAEEERRIEELKAEGVGVTTPHDDAREATPAPPPPPPPAPPPPPPATPSADPTPAPLADEPIAAAAPLNASPASHAASAPTEAADGDPAAQSITLLKGLGPKIAAKLADLGITRVDQLAWLDDAEAAELDARLTPFEGRMERDRWREQARLLAQGDRAGYEAQFGKLG
ncbi:MAG: hypothetical protein PGN23_09870 [Sphingomonas adhaesiva]|uniref:hypothetical protein n=1 Tax=Sphingomonas adhaesiva TaxID=28212 RepID=UPI002FF4768C